MRDLSVHQWCYDTCAAPCPISRAMGGQDPALIHRHSVSLRSAPGSLSLNLFTFNLMLIWSVI